MATAEQEIARVEAMLIEAAEKAIAHGIEISDFATITRGNNGSPVACCPIGAMFLDDPSRTVGPRAAAGRLGIDPLDCLSIATGFDGMPAHKRGDGARWHDLGARLRARFLPNERAEYR